PALPPIRGVIVHLRNYIPVATIFGLLACAKSPITPSCWSPAGISATTMNMSDGSADEFAATRLERCTFHVKYKFAGGGGSGHTSQDFEAVYRKGDNPHMLR